MGVRLGESGVEGWMDFEMEEVRWLRSFLVTE